MHAALTNTGIKVLYYDTSTKIFMTPDLVEVPDIHNFISPDDLFLFHNRQDVYGDSRVIDYQLVCNPNVTCRIYVFGHGSLPDK